MKLTVNNVDEKTIRRLAHEYLSGYYVTLKSLATKYKTSPTTISNILWRGIAEDIIDQRVANCIYNKIVDKPSIGWYQRKLRWDEAFAKRTTLKNNQRKIAEELANLYSQKEYYENILAGYDTFFEMPDSAARDATVEKLERINRRIELLS